MTADYLTCLRILLSRMSPPWPLMEQLNFTHRNMPCLQITILWQKFSDFSTLEYLATQEQSYFAKKSYRLPQPPEQSIFSDLAYCTPKEKSKNSVTIAAVVSTKGGNLSKLRISHQHSVK